jgi:hypothetical protein
MAAAEAKLDQSKKEKDHDEEDDSQWGESLFPRVCWTCNTDLQSVGQRLVKLVRNGMTYGKAFQILKLDDCCSARARFNIDLIDSHINFQMLASQPTVMYVCVCLFH